MNCLMNCVLAIEKNYKMLMFTQQRKKETEKVSLLKEEPRGERQSGFR